MKRFTPESLRPHFRYVPVDADTAKEMLNAPSSEQLRSFVESYSINETATYYTGRIYALLATTVMESTLTVSSLPEAVHTPDSGAALTFCALLLLDIYLCIQTSKGIRILNRVKRIEEKAYLERLVEGMKSLYRPLYAQILQQEQRRERARQAKKVHVTGPLKDEEFTSTNTGQAFSAETIVMAQQTGMHQYLNEQLPVLKERLKAINSEHAATALYNRFMRDVWQHWQKSVNSIRTHELLAEASMPSPKEQD